MAQARRQEGEEKQRVMSHASLGLLPDANWVNYTVKSPEFAWYKHLVGIAKRP